MGSDGSSRVALSQSTMRTDADNVFETLKKVEHRVEICLSF